MAAARILVDHHDQPDVAAGMDGNGFQALLGLAGTGRCTVKLSGYGKFSRQAYPFANTQPFTPALLDRFGPSHCLWASDWPPLRAVHRLNYGPPLALLERSAPDAHARAAILHDAPKALFGF